MYEFNRSEPVTVALRANAGSVEVTAEPRDTIEVEVIPLDGKETTLEAARNTRVVFEDDVLLIQAPGAEHWTWRRSPKLRFTVKVPAGSALAGRSAAARVRAAGVYSVVQLDVASASVEVEEVAGDAQLEAASGHLSIGRVGGSLRIKTASGRLRIGDVNGDVSASSASGGISMSSAGGSVQAKTASGSIKVGRLRQGQARIGTASGSVEVGVAAGTGVWLDLNTASGHSTSDLTSHGDVPPPDSPTKLELRVRTASGNIRVYRANDGQMAA